MDITDIFSISASVPELASRASLLYLGILVLLRILPRRTGGELAMMDLIFVILIAEAATHALGEYSSVTEAIIVVLTMMTWNYLINVLSYHFPAFGKLASAPPLLIIKNGQLLRRNMRREYITENELMEQLRKEGLESVQNVKEAFVEGDGTITVIPIKN